MPALVAGIGITLSDSAPYTIVSFEADGPAAKASQQGMVRVQDVLEEIDNFPTRNMDSAQVNPICCITHSLIPSLPVCTWLLQHYENALICLEQYVC